MSVSVHRLPGDRGGARGLASLGNGGPFAAAAHGPPLVRLVCAGRRARLVGGGARSPVAADRAWGDLAHRDLERLLAGHSIADALAATLRILTAAPAFHERAIRGTKEGTQKLALVIAAAGPLRWAAPCLTATRAPPERERVVGGHASGYLGRTQEDRSEGPVVLVAPWRLRVLNGADGEVGDLTQALGQEAQGD
jgi:hypothetical protein